MPIEIEDDVHHLIDVEALGLDPERARLVTEIFAMQSRVHDEALAIAGPAPTPPELTMQQLRVLGFVAKEPGLAGHELGERLGVSAPTASGLVERLVEKSLLARVDDPDDRRVRRLFLTDEGRGLMRQMDSLIERAMVTVIQNMTVADLKVILHSSEVFLAAMSRARS